MTATLPAVAVIGPGGLIESGVRPRRWSLRGRLDAVILDPDGCRLWHYWRAQDRPDQPWLRGDVITAEALGPGRIWWQPGASRRSSALVVDVPQADGLVRYRCTPAGERQGWERSGLALPILADMPHPSLAQAAAAEAPESGLTEAASAEMLEPGLAEAARAEMLEPGVAEVTSEAPPPAQAAPAEQVEPGLADHRADLVKQLAGRGADVRGACLARTSLGGRMQALVDEAGSVFHYQLSGGRWERSACLRLLDEQPFSLEPVESVRVAQISGEVDLQPTPWGEPRPTLSRSVSTAGVRGTDLGVRVEHAGRSFLLCGDTHWQGRPWLATRDAIAEITDREPLPGLPEVRFHGAPLRLNGPWLRGRVTMREYDVPLDGFSLDGQFYAFFSSNHFQRGRVMGRSVLARAEDHTLPIDPAARHRPVRFRVLGTFSSDAFINVSVQVLGHELWIWGTGPYRAGDLSLAVLDLRRAAGLATAGRVTPSDLGVRYWAGLRDGEPVWATQETDGRPLVTPGAFGELSVRWVGECSRFLLLAGAGPEDPIGPAVTLRTAEHPWGPWSPRRRLLDWVTTGMAPDEFSRFIRATHDDPIADRIFAAQAEMTGAAYAPYFFDATRDGDDLLLRYTLSTWNPYQIVLLQHRLAIATL